MQKRTTLKRLGAKSKPLCPSKRATKNYFDDVKMPTSNECVSIYVLNTENKTKFLGELGKMALFFFYVGNLILFLLFNNGMFLCF